MSLEIIGAGLGRTGTLSLKRALEQLGYDPCYHMEDVVKEPTRAGDWLEAVDSPSPDWDHIFRGFRATVDWPAATSWRQLAAAYPEAKIILSVRNDADQWFDSTQKTIFQRQRISSFGDTFRAMIDRVVFSHVDGAIQDRARCTAFYERHNREVMESVPADRLLVFKAQDGWGPLCAFLGHDVPGTPYPHANKATDFEIVPNEPL